MTPSNLKNSQSAGKLFYFSLFLCVAVLFLILAGGLVTSHEAGLAVPDWPLSYGQLMPPMVGNVFWEHGHRMIAGTVGILTLILAISIQRAEDRGWIKKLGWIALGAVAAQAILGGLTVKLMLPDAISILHACLAQTFFCVIISITYFLSSRFQSGIKQSQVFSKPTLFFMTSGFIYLQLILGAVVRHTHHYIPLHVVNAFLVLIHITLASGRINRLYYSDALMRRAGMTISLMTVIQFFLGIGSYVFKYVLERSYAPSTGEVILTAAHQTTGALILGISILISLIAGLR